MYFLKLNEISFLELYGIFVFTKITTILVIDMYMYVLKLNEISFLEQVFHS